MKWIFTNIGLESLNKEIFKVLIYGNIYRFSIKNYSILIHIINIKSLKVISVFL